MKKLFAAKTINEKIPVIKDMRILKLICEETNIHEILMEDEDYKVRFWTSLGYNNKPDEFQIFPKK